MSNTPDAKRDANQIEFATTMSDTPVTGIERYHGTWATKEVDGENIYEAALRLERDLAATNAEITRLTTVELPALSRCVEIRGAQLTGANATLAEYREDVDAVLREECGAPDEKHCTCVPALRRAVRELTGERDALRDEFEKWKIWLGGMQEARDEYRDKVVARDMELDTLRAQLTVAQECERAATEEVLRLREAIAKHRDTFVDEALDGERELWAALGEKGEERPG